MGNQSTYYRTKQATHPGRLAALVSLVIPLALAGCTVGPKYHQPPAIATAPPPPAYKEIPKPSPIPVADGTAAATEWVPAQPSDAMLRGKWWEIYNEPDLNALEDRLNIDNQTIKEYFENYMVARAIVREARAQYYPTVTAGPSLVPLPRLGKPGK